MVDDRALYQTILGMKAPWIVERVKLRSYPRKWMVGQRGAGHVLIGANTTPEQAQYCGANVSFSTDRS
jgi:hypothetical protein